MRFLRSRLPFHSSRKRTSDSYTAVQAIKTQGASKCAGGLHPLTRHTILAFRKELEIKERAHMARAKKTKNLGKLSLWQLKDAYDIENSSWAPKKRAEVEFALAVALKRPADELAEKFGPGFGDAEKSYRADARRYAHACVNALREMP